MALLSTLTDNFDDNSRDAAKWNTLNALSGTVAESSQRVICTPANSTIGSQGGYESVNTYDLTGNYALIQAVAVANTTNCYTNFYVWKDASNYYGMGIGSGNMEVIRNVGGSFSIPWSAAYNSTNHKWWRIRESGGQMYFDYSADGITWTNAYHEVNGFVVTTLKVQGFAYEHTSTASPLTFEFDNFNLGVSGNDITTLIDDFNDNSIDSTKWNTYTTSGGTVTESSQAINYSLTDSTVGSWSGIYSKVQYNLTGRRTFIKVPDATGGGAWLDLTLSMEQMPVVDNFFSVGIDTASSGTVEAVKEIGGADTILYSEAYSATNHAWMGLRESGGTTYFERSADGITWVTMYSTANIFPVTNLYVVLDDYEHASTTGNAHSFDSYNVYPSNSNFFIAF